MEIEIGKQKGSKKDVKRIKNMPRKTNERNKAVMDKKAFEVGIYEK
jgi:hypothetical protein